MKKKNFLDVSPQLLIPLEVTTERVAWLGNSGSGKSYKCGVFIEKLLDHKQQVVIIEPQGGWHGLRSSADGKGPGYSILIMGGEHGDIPLDPASGKMVADLVVDTGISVILDLSLFETDEEEAQFVSDFLDRLFRRNRHAMHLVLDEASSFAPQIPEKYQVKMLGKVKKIAKRGRFKGIGLSVLDQRASELHKTVLAQIQILVAVQTTSPLDRSAIKDWVRGKATEEEQEQVFSTIASLPKEQAWVWSPKLLGILKRVSFHEKTTFDSTATPKVGVRVREAKVLAPVDIEILRQHMASAVEKAKEEDPTLLRAEVKRLRVELSELQRQGAAAQAVMAQADKTLQAMKQEKVKPQVQLKPVKVPMIKESQVKALERVVKWMQDTAKKLEPAKAIAAEIDQATHHMHDQIDELNVFLMKAADLQKQAVLPSPLPQPWKLEILNNRPSTSIPLSKVPAGVPSKTEVTALRAGEKKVLCAAAMFFPNPVSHDEIGTLSGFAAGGGTYPTYKNRLRRLGYITEINDDHLLVTDGGKAIAMQIAADPKFSDFANPPSSSADLLKMWRKSLRAGEFKMLEYAMARFPKAVALSELLTALQGDPSIKIRSMETVITYANTLKRSKLVTEEGKGLLKARPTLFPERIWPL
jgi:uncharacterized protein